MSALGEDMIDRPRTPPAPSAGNPQELAAGRLRAQRALTRRIRRTVALTAVCVFMASWLLIFVVLADGHDPALARRQTSSSNTSTQANESTQPEGTESKSSRSESTSGMGTAETNERSPTETATTPMTTRQS
jgi:hypothetical protein